MAQPDKTKDENVAALLLGGLQRTIDFLKYAEAKNGALLTFASAWVLAIININITLGDKSTHLYEYAVLPPFVLAGTAALVSFFPRINLPRFLGGRRAGPHPKNLLYFGDVGAMTVSEFEKAIQDNYYPPEDRTVADAYLHDLIVQVAVNSQITNRKLQLFQIGIWLIVIAGIAFLVITAITFYQLAPYRS
jgi:hypothetical protein